MSAGTNLYRHIHAMALTMGLIPRTTAGAFYAATPGVAAIEYAPLAFFNYLDAFVSVAMAAAGVDLLRRGGKSFQTAEGA